MSLGAITLWGFVATVVQVTIMSGSQQLGWTRMSLPLMLGSLFTPDRDRAPALGSVVHLINGWAFAFLYAAVFESWDVATWWAGASIGVVHAAVVLVVVMEILPGIHPRMASERYGPEPTRALEPPGWLALNYGGRTPVVLTASHVVYGVILGSFYPLAG